jgi:hypothetical protein
MRTFLLFVQKYRLFIILFAAFMALFVSESRRVNEVAALQKTLTQKQSAIDDLQADIDANKSALATSALAALFAKNMSPQPSSVNDCPPSVEQHPELAHSDAKTPAVKALLDEHVTDAELSASDQESLSPEDVRTIFNGLFSQETIDTYSDEALLSQGVALLENLIVDDSDSFDNILSAAEVINELTAAPLREDLSQRILYKAQHSDNQDTLRDALMFIAEQGYSDPSLLATELLNSENAEAQMAGVYLLASAKNRQNADPILLNHFHTYPEQTLQLLVEFAGQ